MSQNDAICSRRSKGSADHMAGFIVLVYLELIILKHKKSWGSLMSKKYNLNGEIIDFNQTRNGQPFFRKETNDEVELAIARKLKRNPHQNIVKIYEVGDGYYDMEIVKTGISLRACQKYRKDLEKAKTHFHRIGIVYIDWKRDNMGIGADGRIKVFDFDQSGLLRRNIWYSNAWNKKPSSIGYFLRNAESAGQLTPIRADNWIFEHKFMPSAIN